MPKWLPWLCVLVVLASACEQGGMLAPPLPRRDAAIDPSTDAALDAAAPDDAPLADVGADAGRCAAPLVDCGEASCTDTTTDARHCGRCGDPCGPGSSCERSACVCFAGLTPCGGECVDTLADAANCGMCGRACPAGQVCSAGACMRGTCPMGTTNCAGSCVDTTTDPANCGGCAMPCPAGQACSAGRCGCPVDTTLCGSACVDTTSDSQHCGRCDLACAAGAPCAAGVCGCPPGQMDCGAGCIDVTSDESHCGSCSRACAAGETCTAGMCVGCGPPSTFSGSVQPIFTASCGGGACHLGARPAAGLSLAAGSSYAQLVGVRSGCGDGRMRVTPFDPDRSHLYNKVTGVGICAGGGVRMPVGGALSTTQTELIRSWICRGAMND